MAKNKNKNKGQGSKAGEELTKEKARKLPLLLVLRYVSMKTQKKWRERKMGGRERRRKQKKQRHLALLD